VKLASARIWLSLSQSDLSGAYQQCKSFLLVFLLKTIQNGMLREAHGYWSPEHKNRKFVTVSAEYSDGYRSIAADAEWPATLVFLKPITT
jgi:nitrate/nitrite-specific signal transduction histidine kinase